MMMIMMACVMMMATVIMMLDLENVIFIVITVIMITMISIIKQTSRYLAFSRPRAPVKVIQSETSQ